MQEESKKENERHRVVGGLKKEKGKEGAAHLVHSAPLRGEKNILKGKGL